MNPRDDVILSYTGLTNGVTLSSQHCPSCKGGAGGERSLSVGRGGMWLWWQCHRASCGFRGKYALGGDGSEPTTSDERKGKWERNYRTTAIPEELMEMFRKRYHLDEGTIDAAQWSYTPNYDGHGARVIMPIISPDARRRGHNFRSYCGGQPKSLVNIDIADENMCWYRFKKYAKICVIVEDQVSALRLAAAGVDAVALMGTMINERRITEIREQKHNKVVLCLDNDASGVAVKHLVRWREWLPKLTVKLLEQDIKDMDESAFDLFIAEVLTN